ncbi:MAG: hypothetical protein ABI855_15430 [Bacteroidota bacterium]
MKNTFTLLLLLTIFNLPLHSQTIYQKGDSIVISRFGKTFFKKYITLECLYCQCNWAGKDLRIENCNDSDRSCSNYRFLYNIIIPEKEIKFNLQFSLDKNRDSLYGTYSLPPVKLSRKQLIFLSKNEINKIAYNRRFAAGIQPWRFNFVWIEKPIDEWYLQHQTDKIKKWGKGKFIWSVENLITDTHEGTTGENMCLDAVTGEYLYGLLSIGTP